MKKAMWIISTLALILTAVMLQFLPASVPMHYNSAGEITRWGSKYENLIFPVIVIAISLFCQLYISHYEKKAYQTNIDKERAEALITAKVFKIAGVSLASLFTITQAFILYGAYVEANTAATQAHIDIMKVACILVGAILVILGNFIPKTRKNYAVGIRTSWSMYNDITWMKSNRFGAVAIMIAGLLTIGTAIFADSIISMVMFLVYLLAATIVTIIYSHRIYMKELAKEMRS